MNNNKNKFKGFTLITTLILLCLLSALSIGVLMMVNTEMKVSGQDVQNNVTFHAAEGGIEKMTADIANLFTNTLSPNPQDISTLSTNPGPPALSGIIFPSGGYTIAPVTTPLNCTGVPPGCVLKQSPGVVQSGPFAGLNAQLMYVNLSATAQGMLGDEVQMNRSVEVALIPVFQFGAFSDGDIAFFNNPTFTFNGTLHTNGDLYLGCAGGNTCTFTNKMSAYGNVIRAVIPNGVSASSANDLGTVLISSISGGCPGSSPACVTLPTSGDLWGSVVGAGGNPPASSYNGSPNPDWVKTISEGTLGSMVIDGNFGKTPNSGATNLSLPFVAGATLSATPGVGNPPGPQNYEIIRRPPSTESPNSPLGASRLYNEAAIRILLSDTPEELPGGASDPDNVRLANWQNTRTGVDYSQGVPVTVAEPNLPALPGTNAYLTFFATASALAPGGGTATPGSYSSGAAYTATADWPFAPKSTAGEYSNEFDSLDEAQPTGATVTSVGVPYLFNNGESYNVAPAAIPLCSNVANPCNTLYPYYTAPTLPAAGKNGLATDTQWNLIDGYLRVEFLPTSGSCPGPGAQVGGYCAITREWLGLGFARDIAPPTAPGVPYKGCNSAPGVPTNISTTAGQYYNLYNTACSNDVNPYAILIFQQPKRANTGSLDPNGIAPSCPYNAGTRKYVCVGQPPDVVKDPTTGSPFEGEATVSGSTYTPVAGAAGTVTAFNWYPINFYDPREGEPDDVIQGNDSYTPQGVMNAVELDVGNLNQWLQGNIPGSGNLVNYTNQNGYVLYFSDRRGMLANPNGTQTIASGYITGDAGFEDVVNAGTANRVPDGHLEPAPTGRKLSPEDANLNGVLDNFGAKNLGLGLGYIPTLAAYTNTNSVNYYINKTTYPDVYLVGNRLTSAATARNAWISGARHVLKLIDGSLGNVPTIPGGAFPASSGGFTVGSENPVYIVGNYNTNCPSAGNTCTPGNTTYDPNWPSPPQNTELASDPFHAAAGIVADTVTLLSNSWVDWNSLGIGSPQPTQPCPNGTSGGCAASTAGANRPAVNGGYYRVAIATGDVQAFPQPSGWGTYSTGTDGGMGNFLHLLETWSGQKLNYNGSMVDLFFSTYNTGLFKCCTYSVYIPPDRNFNFDVNFKTFSELPPGTPMFRDIDNLSYRQAFNPCTVGSNNKCSN
jgi:hypothetical protein